MRLYTSDSSGSRWADVTAPGVSAAVGGARWFWLDVAEPAQAEIDEVGRALDIPPDVVADIVKTTEYPKLHEYDDALFAVSHSPGVSTHRFSTHELDIYLTERALVTFHREQ
ncbi:MAG: hypothetical protein OES13_10265, partial [Acidimicrobiia bacterium]|nr:hypothetical protein [Acidimicrobiia bacterium]